MDATSSQAPAPCYASVQDFLQQGDVFRQEVVTPVIDFQKRIFRSADGRHGSVVFADNVPARVFEENDLRLLLQTCERTKLHTDPFTLTHDGHPEFIVVHSTLTSHFIIVSQTCDICGVDKKASISTIILPIVTVQDICRFQRLPFASMDNREITIEEFLDENVGAPSLRRETDAFRYPELVRQTFATWNPQKKFEQDRNKCRKYLDEMPKHGWMYFLKQDFSFQVPESYVDFSVAFTVPTSRLGEIKRTRIACMADPYRAEFAQKFANRLSRIAVPTPFSPAKY